MTKCNNDLCAWVSDIEASLQLGDLFFGHVWWCGDYCDCSEARIILCRKNERDFYNQRTLWSGKFYTDGEGYKHTNTELNRMAKHLRKHHNDFYHRIKWPWSPK